MVRFIGDCSLPPYTDKYLYLYGGKEISRELKSSLLHATDAKCIHFWFKSEGKYFKRSLQLFINSVDSNSSTLIWSANEETPTWTFIQLPLQTMDNAFQVMSCVKYCNILLLYNALRDWLRRPFRRRYLGITSRNIAHAPCVCFLIVIVRENHDCKTLNGRATNKNIVLTYMLGGLMHKHARVSSLTVPVTLPQHKNLK